MDAGGQFGAFFVDAFEDDGGLFGVMKDYLREKPVEPVKSAFK